VQRFITCQQGEWRGIGATGIIVMSLLLLPQGIRSPFLTQRLLPAGLVRCFSRTPRTQNTRFNMEVELTAPNNRKWMQPLGLFINNEFVESSGAQKIASINPT